MRLIKTNYLFSTSAFPTSSEGRFTIDLACSCSGTQQQGSIQRGGIVSVISESLSGRAPA
jgi:hypothetical protein